jgi:hypothetical protein
MITTGQAQQLLSLPKYIVENDRYLNSKNYTPKVPIDDRIELLRNCFFVFFPKNIIL